MSAGSHILPAATGAYPRRHGNCVRPLVDGEPAFRRICEAVEAARKRVWLTVAFVDRGIELPDARGSLFDVLARAAARGLDVRVIFWRSAEWERTYPDRHFHGTGEQREWLEHQAPRFLARWDVLPRSFCHHQKTWLVDAGEPGELAFVGGINLDRESVTPPGHATLSHSRHDAYVEIAGPAATDVHHNFVQRWNEASEREQPGGAWPDGAGARDWDLPFPSALSCASGDVAVQITRTLRREAYANGHPAVGASPCDVAMGEKSVLEQYLAAIDAARRTIYVENQTIASLDVLARLDAALDRGVEIVYVVPVAPSRLVAESRRDPRFAPLFARIAAVAGRGGFTLAGLVADPAPGVHRDVYVHAKLMLVDDEWATIGSTNVADRSFHSDTEMNASFWNRDVVRVLRAELFREHTGSDTLGLDDREALRVMAEAARSNREQRRRGERPSGLIVTVDAATYGVSLPLASAGG